MDLNKESVEITKLSLWLKTADKNKTLASLENNIKCGNSLIDDPEIAGDLAFNWEKEFPEVFANGGFDIVVGNPPYVGTKQILENHRKFYWDKYKEILFSEMDLYQLFIFKSLKYLLNKNGMLGFITPDSYFTNTSFSLLREYLLKNTSIFEIIDFPYRFFPFEEVNTETAILLFKNNYAENSEITLKTSKKNIQSLSLENNFKNNICLEQKNILEEYKGKIIININSILNKMISLNKKLGDYLELHKGWMSVPSKVTINGETILKGVFSQEEVMKYSISENCNRYLEGRDIHRYYIDSVIKYVYSIDMDKNTKSWHFSPKIILQRIVGQNKNKIFATVDLNNNIIFPNANLVNLKNKNDNIKFYLSILNSRLISYFYNIYYGESNTNLTKSAFEDIPIPNIEKYDSKSFFIEKADKMLSLNRELQDLSQKFQRMLLRKFDLEKLSTKLQEWYLLDFSDFIKELKRLKVKLSLSQESEWEEYFLEEKSKAIAIDSEIKATDKEIDSMVYKLYDLTDEEIKIIEEE